MSACVVNKRDQGKRKGVCDVNVCLWCDEGETVKGANVGVNNRDHVVRKSVW